MSQDTAESIASQFSIPPRPEAVITIANEMKKDNPSTDTIANALKKDVTLYSAVIKLINSPLFSLRSKIQSVNHAIMMLGNTRVFSIVKVVALKNSLSQGSTNLTHFWNTSSEVGQVCSMLATRLQSCDPEDAYSLGMFHDSGIPLMLQRYPDFSDLLKQAESDPDLDFAEEQDKRYGLNHYDIGFELAKSWGLNENVCLAIKLQPSYQQALAGKLNADEDCLNLLATLLAAHYISPAYKKLWGSTQDTSADYVPVEVLHQLGISEVDYVDIKDAVLEVLVDE